MSEGSFNREQAGARPRVLELGRGMASAWAGRLLGDHGADVIKLEPPEGDPLRTRGTALGSASSGLFVATNANKHGVTADLKTAAGRQRLTELLAWAEILVIDHAPNEAVALGLDPATLAFEHPGLVTLSITPWGITGPRAGYQATELTMLHGGGWANLCPNTRQDPELPPLKVAGEQSALLAATCGAMTALALWRETRRSGCGEFIDLAQQAYIASVLEAAIPALGYREVVGRRYQPRGLLPWRIFSAKDAPVFLVCIEQDQWERLVEFMGNPEWATLEVFADNAGRQENQDLLHELLQGFIGEWQAVELYHAAQAHRICIAPVLDHLQLAHEAHLHARDFFQTYRDATGTELTLLANPILTEQGRAPIRRTAPTLGEHNERLAAGLPARPTPAIMTAPRLPLEGVRVIDLTWAWAGPFCSMNLAHLGADVIRVESSTRPDLYRRLPLSPDECALTLNTSGMFNQWHQGKRSTTIALRTPEGNALVKELIANADVVVQNFATGVLERLGLGYETLRAINPRIILASISGYGQTGPNRNYMGYGPSAAALSGLCSLTGYVGGGPEELGLSMPDPTSGLTAALGVVQALAERDTTGIGNHIDVSLWEATAVHGVEGWIETQLTGQPPLRQGNRDPAMAPHGCYPGLDADEWVTIACRSDSEWQRLAGIIDPALAADERFTTLAARKANEDALDECVAAWTRERNRWLATRELQAAGIPAFPSLSPRDIIDDAHLNARGFIERRVHPEVGVRPHTGIPWRLTRRVNGVRAPAPCLGADTDAVLGEVLGLDAARIEVLRLRGVLV